MVFKGVTPRMPHRGVREVVGIVSPTTPRQLLEGIGEGELVFTTGMVGYPESLTDPSYKGQMLVMT